MVSTILRISDPNHLRKKVSTKHGSLPATHPDLLKLLQHLRRRRTCIRAVCLQHLRKKFFSIGVGAEEGPLQDIEVDALVLRHSLLETQTKVNHRQLCVLSIFLNKQV